MADIQDQRIQTEAKEDPKAAGAKDTGRKKKGKAVLAIIIIALIALAGVSYYFNLFGVKSRVIDFFIAQDLTYQTTVAEYTQQKDEYEQKLTELLAVEQALAKREQQINAQEEQMAAQTGGGSSGTGSATVSTGSRDVAEVFSQMDKNAAAQIFDSTESNFWIADLLGYMDEKKAADILSAMNPTKAAQVAALM